MEPRVLVVSDPPHEGVDEGALAGLLGLDVESARLKIAFPAPEVLKAPDPDRADSVARELAATGLSVALIDGEGLRGVPWPRPVTSFDFADDALVAGVQGREVRLPYDAAVVAVYCKPPPDFTIWRGDDGGVDVGAEADGMAVAEAIEWMTILDLYTTQNGTLERVSIVPDLVGLHEDDMAETVAECRRRFEEFTLDARLEDVRPRQRFLGGESGFDMDMRKNYSFGTLLLRQALDSISPDLRDVPQYELGSRLAYLLRRT